MKYMIEQDIIGNVKKQSKVMAKLMEGLLKKHNCLRQGRQIGLFGAFDIIDKDGQLIQRQFHDPTPEVVNKFKLKLRENGVFMWVRAPVLHIAPPLIITEKELTENFAKISDALTIMDHE